MYLQVTNKWSLARTSEFGYLRGHATKEELKLEVSETMKITADKFNPLLPMYSFLRFLFSVEHFVLYSQLVNAITKHVEDSFRIIKSQDSSNRKINMGQ